MFLFFFGLVALILGAKLLVNGSKQFANLLGISSLTTGLTIVAFGTSSPEILTCMVASYKGDGGIVIGNIIGSNIFNILAILGFMATCRTIVVEKKLVRFDVPVMIFISLLFWLFLQSGYLNRTEGGVLLLGIIFYTVFLVVSSRDTTREPPTWPLWAQLGAMILGIVLLGFGANWFVKGAIAIANHLNIPTFLVGLTLIAVGTSLPELACAVVALIKKEHEIMIGGLIGSNIFNLLAVGGISGLIAPSPGLEVPKNALLFDLPVMVAAAIATFPIIYTESKIDRWEGILLLLYYVFYLVVIIFKIKVSLFMFSMLFFLLPLTLLVFMIGIIRHFKKPHV